MSTSTQPLHLECQGLTALIHHSQTGGMTITEEPRLRLGYDVGFHCVRGSEMFDWAYIDGNGETTGSSERFETQDAAEAWVGEAWEGLMELGVAEMALRDVAVGTEMYRMALSTE